MKHRLLIYYHTASGNTGWVTGQIARQLKEQGVEVATRNIAFQQDTVDIGHYDMIGFGCPVMGFRPAFSMTDFIKSLPLQQGKLAFIYISYAGISASSLWLLSQLLTNKGYVVIAAERFRGEISWPVARLPGIIPNKGRPDERDQPGIIKFTQVIYNALNRHSGKRPPAPQRVAFSLLNPFSYMGWVNKAAYLRSIMGTKKVNPLFCSRCGMCQRYCGSGAVSLNPYPVFNNACTGCWGCYNICPEKAISTFLGTKGRYVTRSAYLDAAPANNEKNS